MMDGILNRAEDEARTRDLNLGKVALYQLSYFRIDIIKRTNTSLFTGSDPPFYWEGKNRECIIPEKIFYRLLILRSI